MGRNGYVILHADDAVLLENTNDLQKMLGYMMQWRVWIGNLNISISKVVVFNKEVNNVLYINKEKVKQEDVPFSLVEYLMKMGKWIE